MRRYGLTGGIASGKSTVAGMLRELDFPVLEADRIAHQVIEPGGPGYEEVVAQFGKEILDKQGRVDRAALAAVVFADRTKLQLLNAVVHPRVIQEVAKDFAELKKNGARAAFVEAALIFEAGMHHTLHGVVVAWCQPEQQLARLKERGLSEAEARGRMAMQLPVEEKLAMATAKIDCSGSLEETRRQVRELAAQLAGE